jgi:hypothetical protein
LEKKYIKVVKAITQHSFTFFCLVLIWTGHVFCQDSSDVDYSAVIEVGGSGELDIKGKSSNFGADLAIECTPIEHWLELEFGVTALAASGQTELETDLLFKKPYRISSTVEFMFGMGPDLMRKFGVEEPGTYLGLEAVLEFMFWPANNIGWYLEPSFGFVPGREEDQSLGVSAGLTIGLK